MIDMILNLQLFADSGTLTNATTTYINAYDGTATAFSGVNTLTPTMKTYYDTELLENSREKLIFAQLGKKFPLPANHGRTIEWRKWNTLPDCDALTEAVIPTGKKLGMTSTTAQLTQYGEYVTISDLLDLHAIDDSVLGATEELGAAAGLTYDKLVRAVLMQATNVMYADAVTAATGAVASSPASRAALKTAIGTSGTVCYVTPDMVNKAAVAMRKANVDFYANGKYLAVIHPSCAYDLRNSKEWVSYHQYAATTEIFNGEIGELHGVRFLESTLAPIISDSGTKIYQTMFFGKDAFGVIDPEGSGMETIIKSREQVGGPLNQFSTVGTKFEMAAKILYPERVLVLESGSSYASSDAANT